MGQVKNNANVDRDHTIAAVETVKEEIVSKILRHFYAVKFTNEDLTRLEVGVRPKEICTLKDGDYRNFGLSRLSQICTSLNFRHHFKVFRPLSSFKEFRPDDHRLHKLFRDLYKAHELSQLALPTIGDRSYPTTKIVVENVSVMCLQLVEAIRSEPYFWHRETFGISSVFLAAEQMMKQISSPSWQVKRLLAHLEKTAELLEEVGEEQVDRVRLVA